MSWLEFIAQMTSALGWSIVVLIAIIFLGREIKSTAKLLVNRIGDIEHFKAPGVAIDFKEEAKELAEETQEDLAEATDSLKGETPAALPSACPKDVVLPRETSQERLAKYQELAALEPSAAILVPFADLDSLIRQEFRRRYPQEKPTLSFPRILTILQRDGLLDPDVSDTLCAAFGIG